MPVDPPYKMPKVGLGSIVLWRQQGVTEASPALVTRVGDRAVAAIIFPYNSAGMIVKDGIRHSSDPDLRRLNLTDGFWDYSPQELRLQAVEEKLKELGD